ncbi:MAG: hypothetical protein Q3M30_10680 [Candidatus Electrothrix sp. Rat3]|nr:hypothetical protein [Candidatus Electrothrix rattekaaiensis]
MFKHLFCFFYIPFLGRFVAAAEQEDDPTFTDYVIQTVALADKNPHLTDAAADRRNIAEITQLCPVKTGGNRKNRLAVTELF